MDKLVELVQTEQWEEAIYYLDNITNKELWNNPDFLILAAEVMGNASETEKAYQFICKGLEIDPFNYELYYMLGNYFDFVGKLEKAYLCYEMAVFYAQNSVDEEFLEGQFLAYKETASHKANPVSIVIISYNSKEITQNCINSIRETNPSSAYQLVVVDNASTDGVKEWLQNQQDIVLICNETNQGFAKACNQGVEASKTENEVFFLNNDTIVPPNALFWLRMGLYEDEKTGATGCITNCAANGQQVHEEFERIEEWLVYANQVNTPRDNYFEKKIWLVGFALLIKRKVLNRVGLFDLNFGIGNFEDNDLGIRILQSGYELHLCRNSFIYHYGSMGFRQNNLEEYAYLMGKNRTFLKEKWGFDISYFTHARMDIIDLIDSKNNEEIHVLEVGCGAGATLSKIQYIWPNAKVYGIELNAEVAKLGGKYLDIIQGNIETVSLDYEVGYFDYIIFGDVLEHLIDPDKTIQKVRPYLKETGCILASIPNIMHVSVLLPLLKGRFDYKDAGILDRTHVRFFTLASVLEMMNRNCFSVEKVCGTRNDEHQIDANKELYDLLVDNLGDNFAMQSKVYQFVVRGRVKDGDKE